MINVIGLGYIGLPTALMFAKSDVEVIGTDLNEKLVDSLAQGKLTFEEEGLEGGDPCLGKSRDELRAVPCSAVKGEINEGTF